MPDFLKYVPLHSVLFAAWITGTLAFLAQFLPQALLTKWHLQIVNEVWHVPIVLFTVFCFVVWLSARWHAGSKLHVPDSYKDDLKDW